MFGHGSAQCAVKSYCSICAGNHKTTDCQEGSTVKCANCNGAHKSNDPGCPSRISYANLRSQYQSNRVRPKSTNFAKSPQLASSKIFPNTLNQSISTPNSSWAIPTKTSKSDAELFTLEEIKSLTFDLIRNLSNCKTKADQFEVITSLACKFLS